MVFIFYSGALVYCNFKLQKPLKESLSGKHITLGRQLIQLINEGRKPSPTSLCWLKRNHRVLKSSLIFTGLHFPFWVRFYFYGYVLFLTNFNLASPFLSLFLLFCPHVILMHCCSKVEAEVGIF